MSTSGTTPSYPGQRPSGNTNDVRVYQTPQRTPDAARERTVASTTQTRTSSSVVWWILAAVGLAIILYFALKR